MQVIDWIFLKDENRCQTLCHAASVCWTIEWNGFHVTVLYKELCESCWLWVTFGDLIFGCKKHLFCRNPSNLSRCMGMVSWRRGICISGVFYLMGGRQVFAEPLSEMVSVSQCFIKNYVSPADCVLHLVI
jgi:hypothetical protein